MNVRPLVIDDALKQAIAQVREYAEKPEHYYLIGEGGKHDPSTIPGDNPQHVITTQFGYRAVFSMTKAPEGLFRHLSISVPSKGQYPGPEVVEEFCHLYGFTGSWPKWQIHVESQEPHCIIVAQLQGQP